GVASIASSAVSSFGRQTREDRIQFDGNFIVDFMINTALQRITIVIASLNDTILPEKATVDGKPRFLISANYPKRSRRHRGLPKDKILPVKTFPKSAYLFFVKIRCHIIVRRLFAVESGIVLRIHEVELTDELLRTVTGFKRHICTSFFSLLCCYDHDTIGTT